MPVLISPLGKTTKFTVVLDFFCHHLPQRETIQRILVGPPLRVKQIEVKEVKKSCAVVSDTQQTQVPPVEAASHEYWVACDQCNAWRLLPIGITAANLPENWWCSRSTWLPGKNYCDANTYHANSNANSETLPNGWKKNKSRLDGCNSSQVETSHSSMDDRQKRKRLSKANQQLLEKNIVNKPIDVGRNAATVNGEPRRKKLKTMADLDKHDHLTSTTKKNENERQAKNTRASSKSMLLDKKSCEEVELPAKKRKLKDQDDTLPYANPMKEKRLNTSNTDIIGKEKPLYKGNGMKIKLSDLSVVSFLKDYASSQTAMTAFKKAEESKDYVDHLKISGFDYECNDAYFNSALKFLYAASLLEANYNDFSKLKGMEDPLSVYSTATKLSKKLVEFVLKNIRKKGIAIVALAYKCMEVAYMRVVYCKSFMTKQDLQMCMQMVTQGESPSSSAPDVDNLNNQATMMDKTMLSKNITHLGNQVVARSQANFTRLPDFTGDVNLAMEASLNT
nr:cullin, conserved site-containing protein [Tanacetum cinerariifolium]